MDNISICGECNSMTKTYWSFCGKCLAKKTAWCEHCSLKCGASDCECVCHSEEVTRESMVTLIKRRDSGN